MDFRQTIQPNSSRPAATGVSTEPTHNEDKKSTKGSGDHSYGKWMKIFNVVMLVGVAILLAGVALAIGHGQKDNEFSFVQKSKYQAVFLNNGQVYFGNIGSLNDKYVRMTNIYYLTQSGDSTSSNYSLVKLGCQQIHDPLVAMVINRSEVSFWENLQNDGKVVTSIQQFQKQNPNGPNCSQVSNQTQASSSATTQGGTGSSSSTSNSSSTTK
jgi:hypothetical protein